MDLGGISWTDTRRPGRGPGMAALPSAFQSSPRSDGGSAAVRRTVAVLCGNYSRVTASRFSTVTSCGLRGHYSPRRTHERAPEGQAGGRGVANGSEPQLLFWVITRVASLHNGRQLLPRVVQIWPGMPFVLLPSRDSPARLLQVGMGPIQR